MFTCPVSEPFIAVVSGDVVAPQHIVVLRDVPACPLLLGSEGIRKHRSAGSLRLEGLKEVRCANQRSITDILTLLRLEFIL
jgi:hypothetical protein